MAGPPGEALGSEEESRGGLQEPSMWKTEDGDVGSPRSTPLTPQQARRPWSRRKSLRCEVAKLCLRWGGVQGERWGAA